MQLGEGDSPYERAVWGVERLQCRTAHLGRQEVESPAEEVRILQPHMSPQEHPKPCQSWRHTKTGNIYTIVITNGRIEAEGMSGELQVIYRRLGDPEPFWIRPMSNFLERFTKVE